MVKHSSDIEEQSYNLIDRGERSFELRINSFNNLEKKITWPS